MAAAGPPPVTAGQPRSGGTAEPAGGSPAGAAGSNDLPADRGRGRGRGRRWAAPVARSGWAVPVALLAVLIALALGSYWQFVVGMVVIYGIAAMGLTVLTGYSGQISLAHVAFFGFGAYCVAILMNTVGLPLVFALILAVLAGTLVAAAVGLALSRLTGLSFAISTLGITIIFQRLADQWVSVTGGHLGLYLDAVDLFGFVLTDFGLFLVLLAIFVLAATAATFLVRGPIGRRMLAVKGSRVAATGVGISAGSTNLLAFSVAGAYATTGGALYALWSGYLSPDQFSVNLAVLFLAIVVLGTLTSMPGALLAAAVLVGVPQFFQQASKLTLIVNGALLVVCTLVVGGGGLRAFGPLAALRRRIRPVSPASLGGPDAERAHVLGGTDLPDWLDIGGSTTTLTIADIGISFGGVHALQGLSVSVQSGEVLAIIGPNGAGKTTLLNVVTNVYRPDSGRVELDGVRITGEPEHRLAQLGIARTYQAAQKWPQLDVLEHVMVAHPLMYRPRVLAEMLHIPAVRRRDATVRAECRALLRMLGMGDRERHRVGDLPHGELQLLQLARALVSRPRVLLLDEVTGGLTADESAALGTLVRRLAHDFALAVVVIAHDMPLVMRSADRVVVLDAGRPIAEGTPAQIRRDPRVVAAYLGTSGGDVDEH